MRYGPLLMRFCMMVTVVGIGSNSVVGQECSASNNYVGVQTAPHIEANFGDIGYSALDFDDEDEKSKYDSSSKIRLSGAVGLGQDRFYVWGKYETEEFGDSCCVELIFEDDNLRVERYRERADSASIRTLGIGFAHVESHGEMIAAKIGFAGWEIDGQSDWYEVDTDKTDNNSMTSRLVKTSVDETQSDSGMQLGVQWRKCVTELFSFFSSFDYMDAGAMERTAWLFGFGRVVGPVELQWTYRWADVSGKSVKDASLGLVKRF